MEKFNQKSSSILLIGSVLILTGCAGDPVPISEALSDRNSFINKNYAPTSISESVFKKLPLDRTEKQKKDIEIYFKSHVEGVSGKALDRKLINKYSILGNGLVQIMEEYSSNEIPNFYRFSISYEGLEEIKWLDALPGELNTRMPMEIKEITTWSRFDTGKKYTAIFKSGRVMQIANYDSNKTICEVGEKFNAKNLHPKFSGNAFNLECIYSINGLVALKSHKVFIQDLGLAVPVDTITSSLKETLTVVDVSGI
ncbi:hypothetical protein FNL37_0741 [Methylovorus glucosotrophus]|uniref:hypothetical protein n=1 Tax=Methylovorus glucosotrophus TaxID=266009 RepID=UPI0013313463|nr:hypothetical protein [Methylovorus glucosotrophus]KAF0843319.1 hypothetical protein FNL37_0741 [Methylovorus glucosotrophus]